MKKQIQIQACIAACFVLFCFTTVAQDDYLPAKSNWGVTLGMNGLNTIGWDAHTAPTGSVLFRYYFRDCASYRLGFNPYLNRTFNTIDLGDQYQEMTTTSKGLGISLGYQNNFIGTNRMNPYAGLDFTLGTSRYNTKDYTYEVDTNGVIIDGEPWSRIESLGPKSLGFGLRPFVGFEYMVAPKLSLGGEVGYDIGWDRTGPYKITTTVSDGSNEVVTESEGLPSKSFNMSGQASALLTFSYYFMKRCCEDEMDTMR